MDKELIKQVQELVAETEKTHRYSMSKIYGMYNKVFGKEETPQSCASCLIRKTQELKKWLAEQAEATPEALEKSKPAAKRKKKGGE